MAVERWFAALLAAALTAACSPKENPTARAPPPMATRAVADIHKQFIWPGSDALFAAESEAPTSDEGWRKVEAAANQLAEGAGLLQSKNVARDQGQWIRIAGAVQAGARKSAAAAAAHKLEDLQIADGEFIAQCEDCHKFYRDVGGGMMADPNK